METVLGEVRLRAKVPEQNQAEQREVGPLVEGKEEREDVVGNRLQNSIERMKRVGGERGANLAWSGTAVSTLNQWWRLWMFS